MFISCTLQIETLNMSTRNAIDNQAAKMVDFWIPVNGIITRGHQVASGHAANSRYPEGTITMQKPLFKQLGLDLTDCHDATLNVAIAPLTFAIQKPTLTFRQVEWTSLHPPEDFSFSRCKVMSHGRTYDGWIYYPHPETKEDHFQSPSTLEILAPFIPNIHYGDRMQVLIDQREVFLSPINHP